MRVFAHNIVMCMCEVVCICELYACFLILLTFFALGHLGYVYKAREKGRTRKGIFSAAANAIETIIMISYNKLQKNVRNVFFLE